MEAKPEVKSRATHEVVDLVYFEEEGNIAFQGSGQECADFMYKQGGMLFSTRRIIPGL